MKYRLCQRLCIASVYSYGTTNTVVIGSLPRKYVIQLKIGDAAILNFKLYTVM
jgi:hypothetical protein